MLKNLRLINLLVFCLVSLHGMSQEDDDFFQQKINLKIDNQPLEVVLENISRQAGLNFSFDPSLLDTEQLVSTDYSNTELRLVLNELLGDEFTFEHLQNQLIIKLADRTTEVALTGYQLIRGTILDNKYNDAIPYASISVYKQAFGTICNKEGKFEFKLPAQFRDAQLVISCMGYEPLFLSPDTLNSEALLLKLKPTNIRLREIQVTVVDPLEVLDKMQAAISRNYSRQPRLMTAFYREVLTQDEAYINVSEAVIQLLKAPYHLPFRNDKISFVKGRKSPDVDAFKWVDFKMQGGPYYTTQLDVVKTQDSFMESSFREYYQYKFQEMIDYLGQSTYVISFSPVGKTDFLTYEGRLFINAESYALVHAEFTLSKNGMRLAKKQLIRKKPKGFKVRALGLDYEVSYRENNGLWYLNSARSSASFRVRSREDGINSVFHSVSDLLVTRHEITRLKRFPKELQLGASDIFTEVITDYDPDFWANYNIIEPTDELEKAIRNLTQEKPN